MALKDMAASLETWLPALFFSAAGVLMTVAIARPVYEQERA